MKSQSGSGFSRRLGFAVFSIAIIAVSAAASAFLLNRAIAERLLLREADVTQEFLNSVLKAEGTEELLFAGPAPSPALQSFTRHLQNLPDIIRANVYSPDGFIRFSTESSLIGVKFDVNPELDEAFRGTLITKLEDVTNASKGEHVALNRTPSGKLIESYIPVQGRAGTIASVVEFYRLPVHLEAAIADIGRLIWLSAAVTGLLLIVAFNAVYFSLSRNPAKGET